MNATIDAVLRASGYPCRNLRIYKDRLYVVYESHHHALSNTSTITHYIYAGWKRASFMRCQVEREWTPDGRRYRLADGHLPDHCPVVEASCVAEALLSGRAMYAELVE